MTVNRCGRRNGFFDTTVEEPIGVFGDPRLRPAEHRAIGELL